MLMKRFYVVLSICFGVSVTVSGQTVQDGKNHLLPSVLSWPTKPFNNY